MEITSEAVEQVVVRFWVREGDLAYSDALYFTADEYANTKPAAIEKVQGDRFNVWKAILTQPPRLMTKLELQQMQARMTEERASLDASLAKLATDIDLMPVKLVDTI